MFRKIKNLTNGKCEERWVTLSHLLKKETHARIWAACLNGESSIVKNSPYVKDSEKDETIV